MPQYRKFEELPVWQEAARLYNRVLDLIESSDRLLSPSYRNQLERAALSVSNNIAEGFERVTTSELIAFLGIARGSAGEARSMVSVVRDRPKLKRLAIDLSQLRELTDSCARQLTAWTSSLEGSAVRGKRHQTAETRDRIRAIRVAEKYRLDFLKSLKPEHPLFHTREAQEARGEVGS